MLKKSLFSYLLMLSGIVFCSEKTEPVIIDAFISDQIAYAIQEDKELLYDYKKVKQALRMSSIADVNLLIALCKDAVDAIITAPEFIQYNDYITDFQCNLVIKGGLYLSEIP